LRTTREGVLIATSSKDRRVIGYDRFRVIDQPNRVDVFSRQIMFEGKSQVTYTHHHLDPDWTPRRVEVRAHDFSAGVQFTDEHANVELRYPEKNVQIEIPADRSRALVLTDPIYGLPVHLLSRLDPKGPATETFDGIPSGKCVVRRLGSTPAPNGNRWELEMELSAPGIDRFARIVLDEHKNLIGYDLEDERICVCFRRTLASV
jgi:hypothetical protein